METADKKIDFSKIPEADVVIRHINERFRKGLNSNIFIIGLSGTGKSSTSIRIGELLMDTRPEDKKPNITIADSLLELLRALRISKKGDIIIIEEISVLFSSRRSMTSENVSIGKVLDTCRKREVTLISNAPIWKTIDSHMRALGHILIETLRVNKREQIVVSKFHRLQTNPSSGKTYRHTMQRDGMDVSRMFTRMPDLKRWNEYEKKKDEFMDDLYEKLEDQEIAKNKKMEREMSRDRWGMNSLSEKQVEMIKAIDIDKLSYAEATIKFKYADSKVTRAMYARAKEREKNFNSQKQESETTPIQKPII